MTPAERADRLIFVSTHDEAPKPIGGWRWRVVGGEIQLRSKRLPHLRLDLTLTEAVDLAAALSTAAVDKLTRPVVTVSLWRRLTDWLARRTWNRRNEHERALALKQLVEEFAETKGGW